MENFHYREQLDRMASKLDPIIADALLLYYFHECFDDLDWP